MLAESSGAGASRCGRLSEARERWCCRVGAAERRRAAAGGQVATLATRLRRAMSQLVGRGRLALSRRTRGRHPHGRRLEVRAKLEPLTLACGRLSLHCCSIVGRSCRRVSATRADLLGVASGSRGERARLPQQVWAALDEFGVQSSGAMSTGAAVCGACGAAQSHVHAPRCVQ